MLPFNIFKINGNLGILFINKDNYLTIYFDISRIANNEEFFSEELIVKNLFSLIREELAEKFKDSINFSEIKKLLQMVQLDDEYNIREVCEILDIPLQSDFSDTQNLSNFVLEFPQKLSIELPYKPASSLVAQSVKNLPAVQETWVRSPG